MDVVRHGLVMVFLVSALGPDAFASAGRASSASGLQPAAPATRQWEFNDLPPGPRPVRVRPTFHFLDLNRIDDEGETFEFSGLLTLVWQDSRQAFDPEEAGVSEKFYHGTFQFNELSPAWYPQVVLANASGVPGNQAVLLRVKPDGMSTLITTVNAVARTPLNLRRYPFDTQRLTVLFQILGFDAREVILEPAGEAVSAAATMMRVPEWSFQRVWDSTEDGHAPAAGAPGDSTAWVLTIEVQRQSFFMMRLVLLPLMLIVALSWSVFWMDRSSLGDRMSISFVGILTAVAYQLVVSDIMPQISYVTLTNAVLSFSLLVMSATVVVNLAVGACDKRGETRRGDRIDRRCRWIFPLVYAGLLTFDVAYVFVRY